MYHPCLLGKAQYSQPCSSCGLPSVLESLPFGLRDLRQINAALAVAQLAPQIHKTLSPVSGSGTGLYRRSRSCHTLSSRPWAERQNLVYGFSVALALRQVGTCAPLSPSPGLSEEPKPPLNKSVAVSAAAGRLCSWRRVEVFCLSPLLTVLYHIPLPVSRKKSCERFDRTPAAGVKKQGTLLPAFP